MRTDRFVYGRALRERIEGNLTRLERRAVDAPGLRHAAVSVVLTDGADTAGADDTACVLLTLRPRRLKRHGNQYALPGGRLDEGEGVEDAALRELHEELGLALDGKRIIGWLDDFPTRSGFRITPLVIWGGRGLRLRPSADEVAAVYRIPLHELDRPEVPHLDYSAGGEHPVLSAPLPTLGHHVYAPTAAMLYQFREVALRGRMTRVWHYDQPSFAWR